VSRRRATIVLGTGPSAYFLVRSLLEADAHREITVLEAGLKPFDSLPALSERPSLAQPFRLAPTLNIGYGGTSQLWHNVLAPLDREDFEAKPWIPLSGWPICRDDLEDDYGKACEAFGFSFQVFDQPEASVEKEEVLSPLRFNRGVFRNKVFVHPRRYLRTHEAFERLRVRFPSLHLRLGVLGLRFERMGGEETLIAFDRRSGKEERLQAERFVLCCGALNNSEILLNSTPHDANPFLGKCLMDHPMGNYYQFRYPRKVRARIYSGLSFARGLDLRLAWTLTPQTQANEQLGNSAFYLRPAFAEGPEDQTEALKLKLLTVRRKLAGMEVPWEEGWALLKNLNMAAQIVQYKTGWLSAHRLTDCMFVTEQRPSLDSGLSLTGQLNEFGNCRAEVRWRLSSEDLEEVRAFRGKLRDDLMALNGAEETFDAMALPWAQRLSSAAHHLGTARMAKQADSGYVDENLRLFSSEQIYVCDGSVFPTAGNANPTLTCMALGARLARHLARG
jgi:choline dehydrogenase-like flavoprotein